MSGLVEESGPTAPECPIMVITAKGLIMSKKTIYFLSLLTLLLALVSCGKDKPTSAASTGKGPQEVALSMSELNGHDIRFGSCKFSGDIDDFEVVCDKVVSKISLLGEVSDSINTDGSVIFKASERTVKGSFGGLRGSFPFTIIHDDNSSSTLRFI